MSTTYSIGTLGRLSGVNIETIRYYERVQLLPAPVRGGNGYRRYMPPPCSDWRSCGEAANSASQ